VRVAYITLVHTYRVRPYAGHFEFGWEMGRIARSLVAGRGYANPFEGTTGPTAWVAPLYPLLIAGVFRLAGVYTAASAWILLALNSLFSALTVFPVAAIVRRSFGGLGPARAASIGRWSVWLWALYPAAMQYAVRWIWETSLSTLLFTCSLALALRLRQRDRAPGALRDWAAFGLLWGLIGLSNPALVVFLPWAGLWALGRPWHSAAGRANLAGAALGGALCLLLLAPWVARNAHVFHHFVPLRANFGAELCLGNCPGANGLLMEYDHPEQSPEQLRLYARLGELRYSGMRGALARDAMRGRPGLFLRNTLKRVYFFWFGVPSPSGNAATRLLRGLSYGLLSVAGWLGLLLALRRRIPGAWLFAGAFLTLPAMYYVVTVHARFRHPLEPLMAVLAVYLFQSASPRTGPSFSVDMAGLRG
jgi:hypothetical protein